MDPMKRRWAILFWTSLGTLASLSWLAADFGVSVMTMMNISLVGLVATCATAFLAMTKSIPVKWPAIVAIVCSLPMFINAVSTLPHIGLLVNWLGVPGALYFVGAFATTGVCAFILARPIPPPPPPIESIPSARVVD